jgi:hypothetical protein
MCIAGHAMMLAGGHPDFTQWEKIRDTAGDWLGLTTSEANVLFSHYRGKVSSSDAAKVVRHLAATDEIDWSI